MENPVKMDDLGVRLFSETSLYHPISNNDQPATFKPSFHARKLLGLKGLNHHEPNQDTMIWAFPKIMVPPNQRFSTINIPFVVPLCLETPI